MKGVRTRFEYLGRQKNYRGGYDTRAIFITVHASDMDSLNNAVSVIYKHVDDEYTSLNGFDMGVRVDDGFEGTLMTDVIDRDEADSIKEKYLEAKKILRQGEVSMLPPRERLLLAVQAMIDNEDALVNDFPTIALTFKSFLTENDIDTPIQATITTPLHIDAEGYPAMQAKVTIPDFLLSVPLDMIHHNEWEFHFKPVIFYDEAPGRKLA